MQEESEGVEEGSAPTERRSPPLALVVYIKFRAPSPQVRVRVMGNRVLPRGRRGCEQNHPQIPRPMPQNKLKLKSRGARGGFVNSRAGVVQKPWQPL